MTQVVIGAPYCVTNEMLDHFNVSVIARHKSNHIKRKSRNIHSTFQNKTPAKVDYCLKINISSTNHHHHHLINDD